MNDTTTGTRTGTTIWPTLRYADARAAIRFLVDAFGFEEVVSYPGDARDGDGTQTVAHAELRWPGGGGIMLGSSSRTDSAIDELPPGVGSVYIVTPTPDELYERAQAAGARITREMREEDYGSRGFTARDPEGVYWSFGTYGGEG
jgi:uncharacterized glyoxalase superfamily protein PhnB